MQTSKLTRLALGPLLFYWTAEQTRAFYAQAASWPVDRIYLGESVCSRRRDMKLEDWLQLAQDLTAAGKQVVFATQTLIESEADLRQLYQLVAAVKSADAGWQIEASDQSAIQACIEAGLPFHTGPAVNIYNAATLAVLVGRGLQGWCFPVELPHTTLAEMQQAIAEQQLPVTTEVFAYGHLPLAWSARCFTARHHDLPKDRCQFVCQQYPQGLLLRSQEAREVFVLNGIQTLSGSCYNLLDQVPLMQQLGVDSIRLSPMPEGMAEVVAAFDRARRGEAPAADPLKLMEVDGCNGYWFGQAGMERVV